MIDCLQGRLPNLKTHKLRKDNPLLHGARYARPNLFHQLTALPKQPKFNSDVSQNNLPLLLLLLLQLDSFYFKHTHTASAHLESELKLPAGHLLFLSHSLPAATTAPLSRRCWKSKILSCSKPPCVGHTTRLPQTTPTAPRSATDVPGLGNRFHAQKALEIPGFFFSLVDCSTAMNDDDDGIWLLANWTDERRTLKTECHFWEAQTRKQKELWQQGCQFHRVFDGKSVFIFLRIF